MKLFPILESLLFEEVQGKHLVVVDVQPEYQSAFGYMGYSLAEYINENYQYLGDLTFLYNGPELGMIEEGEYRYWWLEQGLEEEIAYNAEMYDKGYAFFRYCMDSGMDDESTTNLIRFMMAHNINDSRDITEEFWNAFMRQYGDEDIRELMEFSDDAINIPDLIEELAPMNNIILCGGGINECLREVEIALDALGKPYGTLSQFTY